MQWQQNGHSKDRGTILVAGNTLFTDMVGEMVARCGFVPAFLVGSEAARPALGRTRPCIVICDCAAPAEGIQRLIAAAASRRIPVVLSDMRMQQGSDDVEALPLPHPHQVAWLTFPISRDAFGAMLDAMVPPITDLTYGTSVRAAGVAFDTAVSVRSVSRVLAAWGLPGSRLSESTMNRTRSDRLVESATAKLADVPDLRSAIVTALAAKPVYEQALRRGVCAYVGAERDAGMAPGDVILALTELVDAAKIVPVSVALALTRRVILWSVEAYFGHLGGAVAGLDGSAFDLDARIDVPHGEPVPVSNR